MKITPAEIIHIANLANLLLSEEEVRAMTEQLDGILNYIAKLNELNTTGIEPMTHAIAIQNACRPDEVKPSLAQPEALANGPGQNGEFFVVPRVI